MHFKYCKKSNLKAAKKYLSNIVTPLTKVSNGSGPSGPRQADTVTYTVVIYLQLSK